MERCVHQLSRAGVVGVSVGHGTEGLEAVFDQNEAIGQSAKLQTNTGRATILRARGRDDWVV